MLSAHVIEAFDSISLVRSVIKITALATKSTEISTYRLKTYLSLQLNLPRAPATKKDSKER